MNQHIFLKRYLIICLILNLSCILFSVKAVALPLEKGKVFEPIFSETFSNCILKTGVIKDSAGETIWSLDRKDNPNNKYDCYNVLTSYESLILGGSEEKQSLTLVKKAQLELNYGITFDFKVHSMANAGLITKPSQERPIISLIPRASDNTLKDYYALVYCLENSEVSKLVANMFKCKWELIRVNQGNGTEIISQGYFMIDERIQYQGELEISNDKDGYVDLAFYIDSPVMPNKSHKPLLKCKDTSPRRINSGTPTMIFQVGGFDPAGFQFTPIVELLDINAYSIQNFRKITEGEKKNYETDLSTLGKSYDENIYQYLRNKGVIDQKLLTRIKKNNFVTISDFLVMLLRADNYFLSSASGSWDKPYLEKAIDLKLIDQLPKGNNPITDFEMASILYRLSKDKSVDTDYLKALKFGAPTVYENAIHYAFQHNWIRFDTKKSVTPHSLNFRDSCLVIMRWLGASDSKFNYPFELPYVIGNGSIFQRNKSIPIWGRGVSGDVITVKFKNITKTTVVENGYWRVDLPPEKEGGPFTLSIRDSKSEILLKDLYIGEVFLISGQSNAEWYLKDSNDCEETVKNLTSKIKKGELLLRYYKPQQLISITKNFTTKGYWYPATEHQINNSSAVGNFFVEKLLALNEELKNVPIGIMSLGYGGSTIELFMPDEKIVNPYGVRQQENPIYQGFWNGFMSGVSPYGFKAVIYYQGENSVQLRYDYERMLNGFITGMRKSFDDKELPFVLVQLTGFGDSYYDEDTWPIIREVQQQISQTMHNVEIVTAIDLSEENKWEIHPKDKKPIGERLAYKVTDRIYEKQLGHRSPEMGSFTIKEDSILIHFDYVEGLLQFKEGKSECFEVLAQDGKWYSANGQVFSNSWVSVTSEKVANPKGARYAYSNYPQVALYDDYMPALPFNTERPAVNPQRKKIDEFNLYLPYHGLNDWDAIVNMSKGCIFRTVKRIDAFNIYFEYGIKKQSVGDTVVLLKREGGGVLGKGSNETVIKLNNHRLKVGDWIRNTNRKYADSVVLQVIDSNTIVVNKIESQSMGDSIEIYRLRATKIVE